MKILILKDEKDEKILISILGAAAKAKGMELFHAIAHINASIQILPDKVAELAKEAGDAKVCEDSNGEQKEKKSADKKVKVKNKSYV